ncbi:MAG: sulfotransferase [Actinobacteria bacterium]|nr:sulfotransferase [Actinomycetota bacterium]
MFLAIASTGRTATSYIAEALNKVPGIAALHEGHLGNDAGPDVLPMVNLDNFQCFKSASRAAEVVAAKRSTAVLDVARSELGVALLVDVAYYNSVLLDEILTQAPDAHGAIIMRDCESFVRSATWFTGTDPMPVGWPEPAKELDARERFIGMGRLRPHTGPDVDAWPAWGGIERNIWLWRTTNTVLCDARERHPGRVHHIDFADFTRNPTAVLASLLATIGCPLGESATGELERALVEARSHQNERMGGYQAGPADTWTAGQRRLLAEAQMAIESRVESLRDRRVG